MLANKQKKLKLIKKYDAGLKKSQINLESRLNRIAAKKRVIDDDYFEGLEEALIMCDIGTTMTLNIVEEVKKETKLNNLTDVNLINQILIDKMTVMYINKFHFSTQLNVKKNRLNCVLVSGINGGGKTTSVAKCAAMYNELGYKVLVIAADTFRAGAVEQLAIWCRKIYIDCFKPERPKQDCASVIYSGLQYAQENDYDLVICDTSGRLQTKNNLMQELAKVHRIVQKFIPDAPHEHLLVLDATIGQNSLMQAKSFQEACNISGLILTKIDSTSKGGIVITIQHELQIPVKFICFGEKIDDIAEFDLDLFIEALVKNVISAKKGTAHV